MRDTTYVQITEWWFVALIAVAFAYFVLRRGLTAGLYMLAATVLGMLLADPVARLIRPWVNLIYRMILAIVRQRPSSPAELFDMIGKQPELVQNGQMALLGSIVFILFIAIGYHIGKRRGTKARSQRWTRWVLSVMVGLVNGYLVAYHLFPRHFTTQQAVLVVPSVNVRELLRIQLALPILITILVVIMLGVITAREGK